MKNIEMASGRVLYLVALLGLLLVDCNSPEAAQSGSHAFAQTDARYAETVAAAQQLVQEHMAQKGVPGVTAAVLVDGQIVWAEGFGLADLENRVPVWPSTKMRVGSVSKSLTSAAIGLLYEQGKLDLDAPIQKYVPSFPQKEYPISTRQVAGHLAGIRHYRGTEFLISKNYKTVLDGLAIFKNDPLLYKPGEKYSYSSYGWNLVSAVIEGAANEVFLTYMRERVFRPLGMRDTIADHAAAIIHNRTRFYVSDNGQLINAPFVDNSYKWAGGGYLSTAEDLVRFGNAMINSDFLKPETAEMLFTPQKTSSGEGTNYGIGWFISELSGRRVVGHGGGSIGGTTVLRMVPDEKVVIALICNLSNGGMQDLGEAILKLFMHGDS